MLDEPSRQQLIDAISGDALAQNALTAWILYAARPMVCVRLLRGSERVVDANDVIQQVCVDVLRALPSLRSPTVESMRGLISTIAERRVRDILRRTHRSKVVANLDDLPWVDSISFGGDLILGMFGNGRSPSSSAHHRDAIERLLKLVVGLDKVAQEILILVFWDGLSTAEAAKRLRRGRTAVANQLRRILDTLQSEWRRKHGSDGLRGQ